MSNVIETAKTLAVNGINAARVRTPENVQWDGKALREYELYFAIPGAEKQDNPREYGPDGKATYNCIRVTVEHSYRKTYAATAKAVNITAHGHTDSFGFGANGPAQINLAAEVPAPRYGRKGLDAFAAQVFAQLAENGMPRDNVALADLWDTIVTAHDVAAPALV